ncbi:LPS export ABC transporter ATP-binding protein [Mariprofundus ferrooxydans]|uniref:ATP/GTP-binding site motif A (P-loop):ABC transporter:AAA ATPase n=1 Tax=Mariprofundus ferrooxydans PV-1 TaxID=314345 RepID=Q0EXN9_9PROT|nr:LPS export ABC transporter ATP-binding protein [Mariprofundus ferrooxydans]EAU54008.1 ATP/GTP-binding site motif A (P-loop):ABC transporter:AAA ATPase [Mariprofundus ferrooxydans PV-1]KON46570.1 sugar ABC transporter ATP-binding protein [Mariprofundus ferrooxydans]
MSTVHHLSARGLCKAYRSKQVVSNVDMDVYSGECIGLLGPNGAGKTTSFYMVSGLIRADKGEISLDDMDITEQPMHLRARSGIGYLPQEASIFRKLSVRDNLLAIFETLNLPSAQIEEELEALLVDLGIEAVQHQKAYTLSGGQRRRTEIARALVTKPKFLLLDEPFAGVDPIAVEDIQAIIAELRSKGIGILITDHNVRDTLSICDRAYLMSAGEIIVNGTPDNIITHPDARRLYLGESFSM